jgi:hypothetical protein
MVLAAYVPINLAGKCGIAAEAEIPIDIEIIVAGVYAKISRGVGEPPVSFHSPLVVIEIARILSSNCRKDNQKEKCSDESSFEELGGRRHFALQLRKPNVSK